MFRFVRVLSERLGVPPLGLYDVVLKYPEAMNKDDFELTSIFPSIKDVVDNGDGTVSIICYGKTEDLWI